MPFFATMPTTMIMPIIETTFSVVPRDEQRGQHAAEREHRAGDDRDRMRERTELDDEHEEHQHDGQDERDEQLAELACCS